MIKKKIWAIHEKATSRHDLGLVKRLLHIHQTPETMLFLLAWLLCYGVTRLQRPCYFSLRGFCAMGSCSPVQYLQGRLQCWATRI